jgi:hypothetical protein
MHKLRLHRRDLLEQRELLTRLMREVIRREQMPSKFSKGI